MFKIKVWSKHKRQPSLSVEQKELLSLLAMAAGARQAGAFLAVMNEDEGLADSQQADDLLQKVPCS